MLYPSANDAAHEVDEDGAWLRAMRSSAKALDKSVSLGVKSHTVVYEAASFLIQQGLLNVKGEKFVNVKQARALLHFAHWLQNYMSRQWIEEKLLRPPVWSLTSDTLIHALIGGPGTGKTTTTKVINALLEFFWAPSV